MAEDEVFEEWANMIRFPSGQAVRPSMERVCHLEPDVCETLFAAGSPRPAMPAADLRGRVDEER